MKNGGNVSTLFAMFFALSPPQLPHQATLISRAGEITVDSLRARDRRCLYRSGRFVSTQCHVKNNFATLQPLTLFPV